MTVPLRTIALAAVLAEASLAMSGCGGGGGGSGGGGFQPPPPITVTRSYPAGRATPTNGGTAWNIVGVTTILTGQLGASGSLYDTLTVKTTFAQDVTNALPPPGQNRNQPTQLGVATFFNVSAYGIASAFSDCTSQVRDAYVTDDLIRRPDGSYGIGGFTGFVTGVSVATSASGHVVTQILPIGAIGVSAGQNIPAFSISVAAENGATSSLSNLSETDCVPPDGSQIPVNGP